MFWGGGGGQHPVENYWSNPVTAILFPVFLASLIAGHRAPKRRLLYPDKSDYVVGGAASCLKPRVLVTKFQGGEEGGVIGGAGWTEKGT